MWAFTWWWWFIGWLSSSPWHCKVLHIAHLCSFDPLSLHVNLKSFNISFLQVTFLVRWSFLLLNNASLILNAFFCIFHFQSFRKFDFLCEFVHFVTIKFMALCLSSLYNYDLCVPLIYWQCIQLNWIALYLSWSSKKQEFHMRNFICQALQKFRWVTTWQTLYMLLL